MARPLQNGNGDKALDGKSFLEQWQVGFNGRLSGALYFDKIALWTLVCLGVLLVVSLVQAMLRWQADRAANLEQEDLLARLAAALTAAEFRLTEYRTTDTAQLAVGAQDLLNAAKEIQRASDSARVTQLEAHEGLKEVRDTIDNLRLAVDTLLAGATSVRAAADRIGDAAQGVGVKLAEISAASTSVAGATSALTRSSASDSALIRTTVAESQRELGAGIGGALAHTGDAIRQALDEWRTEGAIYAHRNETTADQLGLIVSSIEQTISSMDRLPESIQRLDGQSVLTAQRLEQAMTDAVKGLHRELDRFMIGLPDATARTELVINELAAVRRSVDLLCARLGTVGPKKRKAGRLRAWWSR
ncbi:hypothetical protein Acor_62000 [Acrocarpospora corrugata]|uniref:Uncharacterized protein n=1 Tax=Acrocarpospora corrugata TaxID=35763 RepID=A0A5M3WAD1_9ACTN|nr:hypothetical protein [Acrocarpospora corrugata]GES04133.1 hypothetical protein Acor_62000 [Acrocarpospora corrugata]